METAMERKSDGWKPCNARTRSGGRCKLAPTPGNARCRFHGGRAGRPIVHGAYSKLLRKRPGFGEYLDAVAGLQAEHGLSMAPEIETLRARLLEVQAKGNDPQAEATLAGVIDKLRRSEQVLAGLVSREDALEAMRAVMGCIHGHVDGATWDAICIDLARRGLGRVRAIGAADD